MAIKSTCAARGEYRHGSRVRAALLAACDFDPGGLVLMSGLLRHGLDGDASALLDFDVQAVAI